MMENVDPATDQQKSFITALATDMTTDSLAQNILTKIEELSKRRASVCINYLLFRRAEAKVGWKLAEL